MRSWAVNSSRQLTFLSCMVIVILSHGAVRARAWSLRTALPLRFSGVHTLAATSNDGDSDGDGDGDEKTSATGWTHNLPDESSSFWKKTSDSTNGLGRQRKLPMKRSELSSEPRTGWLHNKKPKEADEDSTTSRLSPAQQLLEQAKMKKVLNHRIVAPPSFHACGDGRQVAVTEHFLSLPIYHARPNSPRLDVYFSIVECVRDNDQMWWQSLVPKTAQERAEMYVEHAGMKTAKDMILYLQGGPGFGAPTPIVDLGMTQEGSWAGKALSQYKRVVLMDQRGTGRSTPITKQALEKRFPDLFLLDSLDDTHSKMIMDFEDSSKTKRALEALTEATEYMAQFRADNIVQDAEAIKDALMLPVDTEVRILSRMHLCHENSIVFLTVTPLFSLEALSVGCSTRTILWRILYDDILVASGAPPENLSLDGWDCPNANPYL